MAGIFRYDSAPTKPVPSANVFSTTTTAHSEARCRVTPICQRVKGKKESTDCGRQKERKEKCLSRCTTSLFISFPVALLNRWLTIMRKGCLVTPDRRRMCIGITRAQSIFFRPPHIPLPLFCFSFSFFPSFSFSMILLQKQMLLIHLGKKSQQQQSRFTLSPPPLHTPIFTPTFSLQLFFST